MDIYTYIWLYLSLIWSRFSGRHRRRGPSQSPQAEEGSPEWLFPSQYHIIIKNRLPPIFLSFLPTTTCTRFTDAPFYLQMQCTAFTCGPHCWWFSQYDLLHTVWHAACIGVKGCHSTLAHDGVTQCLSFVLQWGHWYCSEATGIAVRPLVLQWGHWYVTTLWPPPFSQLHVTIPVFIIQVIWLQSLGEWRAATLAFWDEILCHRFIGWCICHSHGITPIYNNNNLCTAQGTWSWST